MSRRSWRNRALQIFIITSFWNKYQADRNAAAWHEFELALFEGDEAAARSGWLRAKSTKELEMVEWAYMAWALPPAATCLELYRATAKKRRSGSAALKGSTNKADSASSSELKTCQGRPGKLAL